MAKIIQHGRSTDTPGKGAGIAYVIHSATFSPVGRQVTCPNCGGVHEIEAKDGAKIARMQSSLHPGMAHPAYIDVPKCPSCGNGFEAGLWGGSVDPEMR